MQMLWRNIHSILKTQGSKQIILPKTGGLGNAYVFTLKPK